MMELAEKISKELGLMHLNQTRPESNVCFANSDELRPEFKETFTLVDLLNYKFAVLHSEKYKDFISADLVPTDRKIFWEMVALGRELIENLTK